ncbi:MAG: hypothetical protein WAW41_08290, partial [Methylobacter sp.]
MGHNNFPKLELIVPTFPVTAIKLRKKLPLLLDAYMDVGSRAPTVGALGDAGAIAERVGVRRIKIRKKALFDPLILTFSLREKG